MTIQDSKNRPLTVRAEGASEPEYRDVRPQYDAERTHPRYELDAPVTIRFADGTSTAGIMSNISLGGARVRLAERPKPLDSLIVEFSDGDGESQSIPGQVRWAAAEENGALIGLCFVALNERARLAVMRVLERAAAVTQASPEGEGTDKGSP